MTPSNPIIPYGYCHCGCGQKTSLATRDLPQYYWIKGEPIRYRVGHSSRKEPNPTIALSVEGKPAIGLVAQDAVIVIDPEDFPLVRNAWWRLDDYGYAESTRDNARIKMHQIFLPCGKGIDPDHKNENKADNRRSNLRRATRSQNMMNISGAGKNRSGKRGVHWDKVNSAWRVEVMVMYKHIHIGRFKNLNDAIIARKEAEERYFGEFS